MIRLAIRTFSDRWELFVGTVLAVITGVAIVHAGMTIILGIENADAPVGLSPSEAAAFHQTVSGASTLTGMTVMLGAFLTVFVVGSTFGFAVDHRRGDLALLRLGGVTSRQVRSLLLGEALLVGLLGAVAGPVVGIGLTVVQRQVLSWLGTLPPELETPVQPAVLALDLVVAIGVSVVGAWGAARRATKTNPLDALRRSPVDQRVMTVRRWVLAVLAIALTIVQVYFSATAGGMLIPLLLGLGIVVTASVVMNSLSPLLVPVVAGLLSRSSRSSAVVCLAVANLRDGVRRTAACAAPMIVLVSLVVGLQGILDTQNKAAVAETTQLLDVDLVASGESIDLTALESLDGISLAAPETTVPLPVQLTERGVETIAPGTVVAVDPEAFRATHLQVPETGDLSDFGGTTIVFGPGLDNLMIADAYDEVAVGIGGDFKAVEEVARMNETLAGTDGFYVDRSILPAAILDRPTKVLIQLEPGADEGTVAQALAEIGATAVRTPEELAGEQDSISASENRAVMAAIVGLGSLYALISVLSTLAISIGQRRSELATLRLTGLTRAEIRRTVAVEAVATCMIGLVLGAVAAVISLAGLWAATARVYGFPVIAIPWGLFAAMSILTAGLTFATAIIATQSALKPPAIHALGTPQ